MNLQKVTLVIDDVHYSWNLGDDPDELNITIEKLQAYIQQRKDALTTAIHHQEPLPEPLNVQKKV